MASNSKAVTVKLDFSKPVFTTEGTPVVIATTTNPVDPDFPVLAYEGSAGMPTKFSLTGVYKYNNARRNLTNTPPNVPSDTGNFVGYMVMSPKKVIYGQPCATAEEAAKASVVQKFEVVKVYGVKVAA